MSADTREQMQARVAAEDKGAPEYQHVIGGWRGNHMRWQECDFEKGEFSFWGHMPDATFPKVGDVVKTEMKRSFAWFKLTKVERCDNPKDMFFADGEPVHQVLKSELEMAS